MICKNQITISVREVRGLLNKKRETRKLLFEMIQPVLPDWSQLLICQYFTRVFLYIYDKVLEKEEGGPFYCLFYFYTPFSYAGYNTSQSMFTISAHTGKYRKKERLGSCHFGCFNPLYRTGHNFESISKIYGSSLYIRNILIINGSSVRVAAFDLLAH